jgi:hypothetical protein
VVWKRLKTNGKAASRYKHTASLYIGKLEDKEGGFMVVFGGSSNHTDSELLNDIQVFWIGMLNNTYKSDT